MCMITICLTWCTVPESIGRQFQWELVPWSKEYFEYSLQYWVSSLHFRNNRSEVDLWHLTKKSTIWLWSGFFAFTLYTYTLASFADMKSMRLRGDSSMHSQGTPPYMSTMLILPMYDQGFPRCWCFRPFNAWVLGQRCWTPSTPTIRVMQECLT